MDRSTPRDEHTLQVILVCGVSDLGPGKQDIRSLQDQEAKLEGWLRQHTALPYESILNAGSGAFLECGEFLELYVHVETSRYDLVLVEDVGRTVRPMHAPLFAESCVEYGTRLILLNNLVDTAPPGWQNASIFSAWHHERANRDTSDRIKRTYHSRFDQGGCLSLPIYGYLKPPDAKSDAQWRKILGACIQTFIRDGGV